MKDGPPQTPAAPPGRHVPAERMHGPFLRSLCSFPASLTAARLSCRVVRLSDQRSRTSAGACGRCRAGVSCSFPVAALAAAVVQLAAF